MSTYPVEQARRDPVYARNIVDSPAMGREHCVKVENNHVMVDPRVTYYPPTAARRPPQTCCCTSTAFIYTFQLLMIVAPIVNLLWFLLSDDRKMQVGDPVTFEVTHYLKIFVMAILIIITVIGISQKSTCLLYFIVVVYLVGFAAQTVMIVFDIFKLLGSKEYNDKISTQYSEMYGTEFNSEMYGTFAIIMAWLFFIGGYAICVIVVIALIGALLSQINYIRSTSHQSRY